MQKYKGSTGSIDLRREDPPKTWLSVIGDLPDWVLFVIIPFVIAAMFALVHYWG